MHNFTFDDIISTDYGVGISGGGTYNAPVKVYEMIEIPGRSGDLAVYGNRLQNVELTYPCFITRDFDSNIEGLRNDLLSKTGYVRLSDSYHTDEYRLGIYQGGLEVDTIPENGAGSFDITFNCKPQRFLTLGEETLSYTSTGSVTNPTNFPARPLLIITGIGTVGIGDYTITLTGSSTRTHYIDCDVMDAWYISGGAKVACNEKITYTDDAVPVLEPGRSGITMDGPTQVQIVPRWWRV